MYGVKEIDASGLKEMLDNAGKDGKKVRLLDVRSQAEYAQGIIEGGEFVPLHTLPLKINELNKDDINVIYCRSGARSAQACMYLAQNTDIEALNLRGGIISWYQSGFEIVRPENMQAQG
jgi:rhodanese-related sulfurtransferase